MQAYTVPHITDIDFSKVTFSAANSTGGKTKVDIYGPDGRKLIFQLSDACEPVLCRFAIDIPRSAEEEASCRRGQSIILDTAVSDAFGRLENAVVDAAHKNCKEWLKAKPGFDSRDAIKARFKDIVYQRDGDDFKCLKFKVKCPGSKVPTKLYKIEGDTYVKDGATIQDLEKPSCRVAPIISCHGLWFISGGQFGIFVQAEELGIVPGENASSKFTSKRPNFKILDKAESEKEGATEDDAEV